MNERRMDGGGGVCVLLVAPGGRFIVLASAEQIRYIMAAERGWVDGCDVICCVAGRGEARIEVRVDVGTFDAEVLWEVEE